MEALFISFFTVLLLSGIFATLGLGGASIYVPIFFWLGIPLETAIASGLFINLVSTGVSTINYHAGKLLDFKAAFWILAGALVGAPLGVWLSTILPPKILIGLFSLVLLAGAFRMIFGSAYPKKKVAPLVGGEAGFVEQFGASIFGIAIRRGAAGGATGVVGGTLGIGGGIFLVPFLIESGFSPKKAAVLSTFVVFFASLFGLIGHLVSLNQGHQFLIATGIAAFVGAFFGSRQMAQGKIDDGTIKRAFALLLVLFGLKLAYDFFTLA